MGGAISTCSPEGSSSRGDEVGDAEVEDRVIRPTAPSFSGDLGSGKEFPSKESSLRGGGDSNLTSQSVESWNGGLDKCPEKGDRVIATTSVGFS